MPGITLKRMPAAASASSSSPPRPNTKGSPPLSRTTRLPCRACATSAALIDSCGVLAPPLRFADAYFHGIAAGEVQYPVRDQAVVQNDVGVLQRTQPLQGQ